MELQFLYIWDEQCIDGEQFAESLGRVLDVYPAVAGRLSNKGRLSEVEGVMTNAIDFTNEGVPLRIVTGHPGSAKDVPSGEAGPPLGKFADYAKRKASKGGPLLTAKLTCFEGGGCILGLVMNHAVFDGWTFAMFMRDWSRVQAGESVAQSVNACPKELLRQLTDVEFESFNEEEHLSISMQGLTAKMAMGAKGLLLRPMLKKYPQERCVLHFSEQELRALKASAEADAGTWVSTNEALLAHLHPLMLEAFHVPAEGRVGTTVPVNLRGKVKGVDERAVGNNIVVACCTYEAAAGKKSWAGAVHEASRAALQEGKLVRCMQQANSQVLSGRFCESKELKRGRRGVILQWNYQVTTPYFELDFGAGRPNRAQPWSVEPVKVMQSPSGGVDVFVHKGPHGIASWAQLEGGCCRRVGSKAQHVARCFKALEEHPRLRRFVSPDASTAVAETAETQVDTVECSL